LLIPQYDTYQLHNGLLVRAQSTGSYKSIILTIVNPKSNDLGLKFYPRKEVSFASISKDVKDYNLEDMMTNSIPLYLSNGWEGGLEKVEDLTEDCLDAKEKLQDINDFIENPEGNIKGRGFNEGLDFFKAGVKGNKEAETAFENFRGFNQDLLDAREGKSGRPGKSGGESMKPSDTIFKPGRDDVQPLGCKFGCG